MLHVQITFRFYQSIKKMKLIINLSFLRLFGQDSLFSLNELYHYSSLTRDMGAGHTGTANTVCSVSATNPCTGNINTRSKDVHTRSVVGKVRSLVINISGTNSYSLSNEYKIDFPKCQTTYWCFSIPFLINNCSICWQIPTALLLSLLLTRGRCGVHVGHSPGAQDQYQGHWKIWTDLGK